MHSYSLDDKKNDKSFLKTKSRSVRSLKDQLARTSNLSRHHVEAVDTPDSRRRLLCKVTKFLQTARSGSAPGEGRAEEL